MKSSLKPVLTLSILIFSGLGAAANDTGWTLIRVCYPVSMHDLQSIPRRVIVYGLDLGLPATFAKRVVGLQVGLLADTTDYFVGLQVGGAIQANRLIGIQVGGAISGTKVSGIQLGAVANIFNRLEGLQLSLLANNFDYNRIDQGNFYSEIVGFQIAPVTNITTTIKGAQIGAFNFSRDTSGFQIGITSRSSGTMKGVQIGLVNWCGTLKGLQVGLINHVRNRALLKTTPLINLGF